MSWPETMTSVQKKCLPLSWLEPKRQENPKLTSRPPSLNETLSNLLIKYIKTNKIDVRKARINNPYIRRVNLYVIIFKHKKR